MKEDLNENQQALNPNQSPTRRIWHPRGPAPHRGKCVNTSRVTCPQGRAGAPEGVYTFFDPQTPSFRDW